MNVHSTYCYFTLIAQIDKLVLAITITCKFSYLVLADLPVLHVGILTKLHV